VVNDSNVCGQHRWPLEVVAGGGYPHQRKAVHPGEGDG
jgi:hypothetical protein